LRLTAEANFVPGKTQIEIVYKCLKSLHPIVPYSFHNLLKLFRPFFFTERLTEKPFSFSLLPPGKGEITENILNQAC
jgi:hypothetical protein